MIDLISEAKFVQDFFEEQRWPFCFIGGLALLRWGEPRLTDDVDATVFTGFGNEAPYVDALLRRFRGRLADARESRGSTAYPGWRRRRRVAGGLPLRGRDGATVFEG